MVEYDIESGRLMRLHKYVYTANAADLAASYEELPKVVSLCHSVLCAMSLLLQQTKVSPAAMAILLTEMKIGPLHLKEPLEGDGLLAAEWYLVI